MLTEKKYKEFQNEYFEIIKKTGIQIPSNRKKIIELVDFGLSDKEGKTFKKIGLGVDVLVNMTDLQNNGYCGKVLIWLPGQYMPEHRHQTVYIFNKKVSIPSKLIPIKEKVKNFEGLKKYPEKEYNYLISEKEKVEIPNLKEILKYGGEVRIGKTETFWPIYGEAWLYMKPEKKTCTPSQLNKIPKNQIKYITYKNEIHLTTYNLCTIPVNTHHSIIAGDKGFICIEFSTPSWDKADIFTQKEIERETLVEIETKNKIEIIPASKYFQKKKLKLIG